MERSKSVLLENVVEQRKASIMISMETLQKESEEDAPWYLVHPDWRWVYTWDAFTGLTLMFVAVFAPFEVAFLPAPMKPDDTTFILGRYVDAVFLVDLLLQFFLMVPSNDDPNKMETSHRKIVMRYIEGWFGVDLFCLAVSAFDIVPVAMGTDDDRKSPFTSLRVIRILRLAKLVRLIKASKRIRDFSVNIATPRFIVTIGYCLIECIYVTHIFACILSLLTVLVDSPLESWLATLGYCRPDGDATNVDGSPQAECVPVGVIYHTCMFWSAGMLMGAPISMLPHKGPYERHYANPDDPVVLTQTEVGVVLFIKTVSAFEWLTVVARFVNVYNNLDPDAREFKMGWDLLNSFISYFRVQRADAKELRRYFIERADEARAKSRMRVMNDFSPYLAEKFVWKLNKDWLIKVPCFSLVVERLTIRPESGMERFLVKVALAMQPSVFVPMECPPELRLYIITEGDARFNGKVISQGDSWGAEEIMLQKHQNQGRSEHRYPHRAMALTYLHVLWVSRERMEEIGKEHRDAYLLVKLWATVYAAGTTLIGFYRQVVKRKHAITVGTGPGQINPEEMEDRINDGRAAVVRMTDGNGMPQVNSKGEPIFTFKHRWISLGNYEIVKDSHTLRNPMGKKQLITCYRLVLARRDSDAAITFADAALKMRKQGAGSQAAPASASVAPPGAAPTMAHPGVAGEDGACSVPTGKPGVLVASSSDVQEMICLMQQQHKQVCAQMDTLQTRLEMAEARWRDAAADGTAPRLKKKATFSELPLKQMEA